MKHSALVVSGAGMAEAMAARAGVEMAENFIFWTVLAGLRLTSLTWTRLRMIAAAAVNLPDRHAHL